MITTKISLKGMHCKSCALLIEEKIKELPEVQNVHVNFRRQEAEINYHDKIDFDLVIEKVRQAGYDVGDNNKKPWFSEKFSDYRDLVISLLVLVVLYFIVQTLGLTKIINFSVSGDPSNLAVVGLLGITAGFSTCMALVGGLLLGISARHAEKHPTATRIERFRPHLFFNLGRIISYIILGGLIGTIGKVFQVTGGFLGFITIVVGFVMFFLGLQLVELSPRLSRFSFTLPSSLARIFGFKRKQDKEYSHRNSFLVGALTFFLPCGFTQATQLFAMSSGSFISGALIMGIFALGTAPGLLSLGGLTSVVKGSFAKKFYKFIGVVVIVFALITLSNGYNLSGWKSIVSNWDLASDSNSTDKDYQSFFNSLGKNKQPVTDATSDNSVIGVIDESGVQVIKTTFESVAQDISPNNFTVQSDNPVRMEVTVNENGQGCMSTIMVPGLYNTPIYLQQGKTIVMEFTPTKPGTYEITCAMGVPRGKIIVK